MKRIIFILFVLMSFCAVNAQTLYPTFLPSPKGDSALAQYGYILPKVLGHIVVGDTMIRPKYNGAERLWAHAGVDTAIWCWLSTKWVKISSSGSGGGGTVVWGDITGDITNQTDLVNYIDSVVNAHGGGTTEYVVQGYGVKVDSALRVYTVRADTVVLASKTWFYNRIDSLILTFDSKYVKYTDTASMLSHYVRRVLAGTNVTVDNTNPQYPIVSATGSTGVSSFSSGNLSPLFTTSVATSTTTPVLSFALSNATAWQTFARHAGTTGAPSYGQLVAEHLNTTYSNGNMLITNGSGTLSWTTAGITPSDTAAMLSNYVRRVLAGTNVTVDNTNPQYPIVSATGGSIVTPAALTKTDDTNVTLLLGGSPSTALLQATSLTLGWTGALSLARGGTNNGSLSATNGGLLYMDGTKVVPLGIGTNGQHLIVNSGLPAWRDSLPNNAWLLTGNTGITAYSNFLGTTDSKSLWIRTNNIVRAFIDSATGYVGINQATPTAQLHVVGGDGLPTLGSELLSSSGWTSTNWTGSFAGGWTHTTGNTTALTNTLAGVVNNGYRIGWTITGRTAGSITVGFSGWNSAGGIIATGEVGIFGFSTGTFSITPTSTFDGTIIVTVRQITGAGVPIITAGNSTGSTIEFRTDTLGNVGIGLNALGKNVSGNGIDAQYNGIFNTAIGYNALAGNIVGYGNTSIGQSALGANTYGYQNTAIGNKAMNANTTGVRNVAIGDNAMLSATAVNNVTAVGWQSAGSAAASGTYIGNQTGANNTGTSATLVGMQAGNAVSTFASNNMTAVGYQALFRHHGAGNTAVGYLSLANNGTITHTGTYNTAIGNGALYSAAVAITGSYNIGIGNGADLPSKTSNDQIQFWVNAAGGTGGYNALTRFTGGQWLINNTTSAVTSAPNASAALEINGTTGGLIFPRLTTTQKNALTAAEGMVVYDITLHKLSVYTGSAWETVQSL